MKRMRIAARCLSLAFLTAFAAIILGGPVFHAQPGDVRRLTRDGQAAVITREKDWCREIGEVIATGEYVYVLYPTVGMVRVQDASGAFLYTAAVPDDSGVSRMYAQGGRLFIRNVRDGNRLYEFVDGAFVACHGSEKLAELRREEEAWTGRTDATGNAYRIRGTDVVRTTPDGQTEVFLDRPGWYIVSHFLFTWCVALGCIAIIACARQYLNKQVEAA